MNGNVGELESARRATPSCLEGGIDAPVLFVQVLGRAVAAVAAAVGTRLLDLGIRSGGRSGVT
jgi:uncharacterized membrane protein